MRPNPGGNEQITALAGILLIVFLAVEGATLLNLRALLTVHAFVGMFLIPIVALKLGSTGWRMASYYLGRADYVRRGPPPFPLRVLVAPVVVRWWSPRRSFSSGPASTSWRHTRRRAPRSGCTR